MSRMLATALALSLFLSALGWTAADEHEPQGPVVKIAPFTPEASTFWIFGTDSEQRTTCGNPIWKDVHNVSNPKPTFPIATNEADNAQCTRDTNPGPSDTDGTEYRVAAPNFGDIDVWFAPAFTNNTPFDSSKNIKGEITLGLTKLGEGYPNIGFMKPQVRLIHRDWDGQTTQIGESWTADKEFTEDYEGPGTDDYWDTFAFDLGAAPETIEPAGSLKLRITLRNSCTTVPQTAICVVNGQEINAVGQRIQLSIKETQRGFIELPFSEESIAYTPGYQAPGNGGGGNGGGGGGDGDPDAPVAAFDIEPASDLFVGTEIAFNASASSDPNGGNLSYSWDFGDGNTGDGVTATHSFEAAGNHTVTLTVTNDAGLESSTNQTLMIAEGGSGPGGNVTKKESGFLPGFEVALVAGVAFVGAALAARRRPMA